MVLMAGFKPASNGIHDIHNVTLGVLDKHLHQYSCMMHGYKD
jgi:hypothetical protein